MATFPIRSEHSEFTGKTVIFEYYQADSFEDLPKERLSQSYAVAFHGDKMVIVHNTRRDTWGLVGGSIEKGESKEDALCREVQEESNMNVLRFAPIGYQKVTPADNPEEYVYQLRYAAIVEPLGPFVSDPAGSIDKIAEINPADYKQYFDWGETGDVIIQRALEVRENLL